MPYIIKNYTEMSMTNQAITIKKHVFLQSNTVSVSAWKNIFLRSVFTPLGHFLIGNLSSRNCSIDVVFPTFELGVQNVLTSSFGNDQYTSFTNQKIDIQYSMFNFLAQLRSYLRAWHADMYFYQKGVNSNLTKLDTETHLRAPVRFEPVQFQF